MRVKNALNAYVQNAPAVQFVAKKFHRSHRTCRNQIINKVDGETASEISEKMVKFREPWS